MKTIRIILKNHEVRTVRMWRILTVFGEQFGIHRTPTIGGESKNSWSVTHIQTGLVVVENQPSRNKAEIVTTQVINQYGKEELTRAIKAQNSFTAI